MNRIDRLNAILIHLQGKPRVPIEELEERFELSRRTIFRDIKALLETGVPIGGNAGEGYFIVEGYHLPPVVFNKEEAAALLMGAKFVEQNADKQTTDIFSSAMFKVKAVLRHTDKEFLDALESRVIIRTNPRGEFPESHISELQRAVANNQVLKINYTSGLDQITTREVEPLGMVFYSSHWHLVAFCRLRQDLRDFRADRIGKIDWTGQQFDPMTHPDYMRFLQDSLMGTDAKEVVIEVAEELIRFMGEQKYYQGFVEQSPVGNGKIEMKFIVPHYDYFARWLLMYGPQVEIISPLEMKDHMQMLIQKLVDHYQVQLVSK